MLHTHSHKYTHTHTHTHTHGHKTKMKIYHRRCRYFSLEWEKKKNDAFCPATLYIYIFFVVSQMSLVRIQSRTAYISIQLISRDIYIVSWILSESFRFFWFSLHFFIYNFIFVVVGLGKKKIKLTRSQQTKFFFFFSSLRSFQLFFT